MTVHICQRKTVIREPDQWRTRLEAALPRIEQVLRAQPGFLSAQYLRDEDDGGKMAFVSHWTDAAAVRSFLRGGGAATAATWEEDALPTAPYPQGTWWRGTYEPTLECRPHG